MRVKTELLGYGGILLLVLGLVIAITLMSLDPQSAIRRAWARYVAELDKEVKFLFMETTGAKITRNQLLWAGVIVIIAFVLEDTIWLFLIPVVAVVPMYMLKRRHVQRVEAIERQLDSWLLLLANALKATPSLGEAIRNSARIIRPPIQQELDLMIKEVNLGTPLDQAVIGMSDRVKSRTVSGALAAILVGRQTGGDLPRILEESAATLREMERLEGVVRTKTAEGKSQAWVLGAIPFVLIGAIQMIDPLWLIPLTESTLGYIIIGVALVLWLAAILAARKILNVDI
jgi:tight adherence protein B